MSKVPATCQNRHEKLTDQLDQFEKVAGHQNEMILELQRAVRILSEAIEQLAADESPDLALALAQPLTAERRRG